MTRRQIKQFAMANVRAYVGSETAADPISLDRKLSARTNELANLLDAMYMDYFSNIVSGQDEYCASALYKIDKVLIKKADGTWFDSDAPAVASQAYGSDWLTNPVSGDPNSVILFGRNLVRVYPVPNYNMTAGLHWWGYGTPEGAWDAEDDECPLPLIMHDTLVEGLSADWLRTAPITDPNTYKIAQNQAAYHEQRYKYLKGHHESDSATITEQARMREDSKSQTGSTVNPLNMTRGPLNRY